MTKRIKMSEAVPRAKCAKSPVNHACIVVFVAINGHWEKLIGKLIRVNDSIGELALLFQPAGELSGKCRLSNHRDQERYRRPIFTKWWDTTRNHDQNQPLRALKARFTRN
jgi:hypothetical protein